MLLFAVTTFEKLKQVPKSFWINAAIVILGLVLIVVVLRKIKEMNKIVLGIILAIIFVLVGFNWIYERNEPRFLTPFVDMVAPFFPTKGSYGAPAKPH